MSSAYSTVISSDSHHRGERLHRGFLLASHGCNIVCFMAYSFLGVTVTRQGMRMPERFVRDISQKNPVDASENS